MNTTLITDAAQAHSGQTRKHYNVPYIVHCARVATVPNVKAEMIAKVE